MAHVDRVWGFHLSGHAQSLWAFPPSSMPSLSPTLHLFFLSSFLSGVSCIPWLAPNLAITMTLNF